jgi:hypothetical protein
MRGTMIPVNELSTSGSGEPWRKLADETRNEQARSVGQSVSRWSILLTAYAAQTDWSPHKIVLIAVVTGASASIMALIDELALDRRWGHPTARA